MKPLLQRIPAVLALVILVMGAYLLWARPYQLTWGATQEEINRSMPGDELEPDPTFLATRAISIEAAPEEIWPWLVQMGYGRAGFYGYDILENLGSSRGLRSADSIVAEFQGFEAGDAVPISPVARLVFYAVEPNRYLTGMGSDTKGGFTWALYPIDENNTRLVSSYLHRLAGDGSPAPAEHPAVAGRAGCGCGVANHLVRPVDHLGQPDNRAVGPLGAVLGILPGFPQRARRKDPGSRIAAIFAMTGAVSLCHAN